MLNAQQRKFSPKQLLSYFELSLKFFVPCYKALMFHSVVITNTSIKFNYAVISSHTNHVLGVEKKTTPKFLALVRF